MKESIAYKKAFELAVMVVKFCIRLKEDKREYDIARQLLRCGTSIGANLAEANGAISNADFSAKVSISYKETLESKYWLKLLNEVNMIDNTEFEELYNRTDEVAKILFSILKTTRIRNNEQ